MKKVYFPWIIFFVFSCNNATKENPQSKLNPVKKTTEQVVEKEPKRIWLNDQNCTSFLLDYGKKNTENRFIIHTEFGDIEIELYPDVPIHRANMVYLIKEKKYFDGTFFYRVVADFIAQAGNNDQERNQERRFLIGKYTLPNEINPKYFHQVGSVAMARNYNDNPDKRSSAYEFYIITGKKQSDFGLDMTEKEYGLQLTKEQRETYMQNGGAPHLDGEHTIIGKVTKGLDVAIKISKQPKDGSDWPLKNIPITIELVK